MRNIIKIFFATFIIVFLSVTFSSINTFAENEEVNIIGKKYNLEHGNDYKSLENREFEETIEGENTYGSFFIQGSLKKSEENKDIGVYEVFDGNIDIVYTYSDSLLTDDKNNWHLSNDNSKVVEGVNLDEKINKGVIILQTSNDRKNWTNEVVKTNAFEKTPIETQSFYTSNDIQLTNGCYYRVIVAYETRIKVGTKKHLGIFIKDDFEYKNHAEVYEFYAAFQESNQKNNTELKFSMGNKEKVTSNGYTNGKDVTKDDLHYGWNLGKFFVSGYTSHQTDENNTEVFLKNAGDQVTLWFNLEQNIDMLNGEVGKKIASDNDGHDQYFETLRTDFGRGTLIVRYVDHENITHKPTLYKNYLVANTLLGTDTKVQLFDEGDYEVALDYVIENDEKLLGLIPQSNKTHYKIFFKFSVRNGNCMVFPFDTKTGAELTNASITENGFYIDLAKSRYLDVNVKKEVLNEGLNELVEDIRYNRPTKDGDEYTEEGIYTISVKNKYTQQITEKKIYIGTNDVLRAHVTTGLSISNIQKQMQLGAKVNEQGTLENIKSNDIENDTLLNRQSLFFITVVFGAMVIIIWVYIYYRKIRFRKDNVINEDTEETEGENL